MWQWSIGKSIRPKTEKQLHKTRGISDASQLLEFCSRRQNKRPTNDDEWQKLTAITEMQIRRILVLSSWKCKPTGKCCGSCAIRALTRVVEVSPAIWLQQMTLKKAKARPAAESLLANAPSVFFSFCSAWTGRVETNNNSPFQPLIVTYIHEREQFFFVLVSLFRG